MRRAEVAILGPPSLMVMLVPAGLAALLRVGLIAVLVAAVSAVHTGHLAGAAARDAGAGRHVALARHYLVVQFGGQHADDGVQRLDAREPVAAHAACLGL